MTTGEEARTEFTTKVLSVIGQRGFVGARAEGDFVLLRERVRGRAVPYAGKFKPVKQNASLGCRAGAYLDTSRRAGRQEPQDFVDAGPTTLAGGMWRECVHEAPDLV